MKHFLSISTLLLVVTLSIATPPRPQIGYRWVLQSAFSDEFNGGALDQSKWRDYFVGWQGRSPAKFDPSTISVTGGNMVIRNKPLIPAQGQYTIAGGAVQSLSDQASFGYYECRFKASRITMSTTFWMSNSKVAVNGITKKSNGWDCPNDRYSQELDICESVGGAGNFSSKFRTQQNFNTHYRYVDCNSSPEKFYSAGNNAIEGNGQQADASIDGESWEDFHTYACYWKDANYVDFYTDNNFAGTVQVSTEVVDEPFPRAMKINMVTETYNWAKPYPSNADLNNAAINASYYDWIRSYKLVPVDQANVAGTMLVNTLYQESTGFVNLQTSQPSSTTYSFPVEYQANSNRDLHIVLRDQGGSVVKDTKFSALAGYGYRSLDIAFASPLATGTYTLEAELRPENGGSVIALTSEAISVGGAPIVTVSIANPPNSLITSNSFTFDVDYTADATRDLVVLLNAPDGTWLANTTQTVQAGSGSLTMTIDVGAAPLANNAYKFTALLREVGGDWSTNIVTQEVFIDLLEEGSCLSELVINGCFEEGDISNWGQWGAGSRSAVMGAEAYEGNYALKVTGVGAAEQTIVGLQPNTAYKLKAQTRKVGNDAVNLGVKEYGTGGELSTPVSTGSYGLKEVEFTTGATNTSAKVYFYSVSAGGEGYADNFTVEEVLITGNSTENEAQGFSLFPNPTTGIVHLSHEVEWTLLDVRGEDLKKGNSKVISMSDQRNGVYIVKAGTEFIRVLKF